MKNFKPFTALYNTLKAIEEIGVTPDDLDDAGFFAYKYIIDLNYEDGVISAEHADEMLEIKLIEAIQKKRDALDRWNCRTAERFALRARARESSIRGAGDCARST